MQESSVIVQTAVNDVLAAVLIACLLITLMFLAAHRSFLIAQVRTFFFSMNERNELVVVNAAQRRLQLFLSLETSFMYAVLYYFYARAYIAPTFTLNQNLCIALFFVLIALFFLLKVYLTAVVNWIFFDEERNKRFMYYNRFLLASEGLFLMPIVFIQAYYDLPPEYAVAYVSCVLIFFRLLAVYKEQRIFFRQISSCLGFFIYLCTLEIAPFFVVWNVMTIIVRYIQ